MSEDRAGMYLILFCFIMPPAGLIIFFVTKKDYPTRSKLFIISSLIGLTFYILLETGIISV